MKMLRHLLVGALFLAQAAWADTDVEGSKDHPLLSRMPNYYIAEYEERDFDQAVMRDAQGEDFNAEGRKIAITYQIKEGARPASELAVARNYVNALKKIGGKVVRDEGSMVFLTLDRGGKFAWVSVYAYNSGDGYQLIVVEKEAMAQEVVADAASLARDISETGRVALYGIHFDTGKAQVKPESAAALTQVATLLKNDPKLKLYVVGHTDGVGELNANLKLSQERAKAVVQALTATHGIAAARLSAHGVGPISPVASNDSEDGRAKNRRVELVKQ